MRISLSLFATIILLAACGTLLRGSRADDDEQAGALQLPIQHSKENGDQLWYQPIRLRKSTIRFYETQDTLSESGKLLEYTLSSDQTGQLNELLLVVRSEPQKWRLPPPNSQAAQLPDSNYTVYSDLDGDSVFDTMVKVGPGRMSSYILADNRWIAVQNSKAKWKSRRIKALDGGFEYYFGKGGWRR